MKLDIHACLHAEDQPLSLEQEYGFNSLGKRHPQLVRVNQAFFTGNGIMSAGVFQVIGTIEGVYTLRCARCLSNIKESFKQTFEEQFDVYGQYKNGEKTDVHSVEENATVLDLQPYIEEEILVSIPIQPTCNTREKCIENIPHKGNHWHIVTDEDKQKRVDPRLAKLQQLFEDEK